MAAEPNSGNMIALDPDNLQGLGYAGEPGHPVELDQLEIDEIDVSFYFNSTAADFEFTPASSVFAFMVVSRHYQHQLYTAVLNGKLYLSPIGDRLKNVLDVGTGTGIWAIEVGLERPGAHVTGIDLSPIQPSYAPTNVSFEICDAEDEWSFRQPFDLVHMRAMVTCFKNPRAVFEEAYRSLAPGGFIELRDPILPFQFLTPPPEGCALHEWGVKLMEAAALSGRDWGVATRYTQMLSDIGFVNVTEKREAIALSPWVKGSHNKELSLMLQHDILSMLEPVSMALFTRVLGWEARRVLDYLELVKRDVQNTKIHAFSEG
ncbi:hypothetical protein E0Z10_g7605 [Xylaria hypoxylon]|uniref:Methyltransferase domain-containing protein n=1 Tax=Xylaria hypoxylon TaxID=37992 RepID=A0A4Z0YDF5_9PEZI|nr:hypothetical protein E0Z10_g7605 [Xylaria hypoxylon]